MKEEVVGKVEVVGPKPGYQTTEFWLTLVSQLVPILVLTGALSPEEATEVQEGTSNAIVTGFAFIQAVVTAVMYIYNRARVKSSHLTASQDFVVETK